MIYSMAATTALSIDERVDLVTRNTEEVLTVDELRELLATEPALRHYIGFEISGRIHLGTGLVCMAKLRDFTKAGISCTVFLADWHTWINEKLDDDRNTIRSLARDYFQEGLVAAYRAVGGREEDLTFLLGSDLYTSTSDYWSCVVDVSKHTTLARMQRSITILGRQEGANVDFAKLIYPAMQAADIFAQGVHLAHAGIDQRKAHVIARDVALQLRMLPLRTVSGKQIKPMAVHHPLLLGLKKPPVWPIPDDGDARDVIASMKMSKSDPQSAVFIDDDPDTIRKKVRKAFCPPGEAAYNPVLNWWKTLVFSETAEPVTIPRTPENGGPISFASYGELEAAYLDEKLHPLDAKDALATILIDQLEPAREYLASSSRFQEAKVRMEAILTSRG